MWLLDLRLKSLNKIYFYYTDPTSVLPYGNIRCSIENRTKHGGTGVQMPLGQNQNIRCRKNFEKVSVIHISSGRSHEQKKEMDVFNLSDKVTFVWNTRKSALVDGSFSDKRKQFDMAHFFFSWSNLPTEKVSMVFSRLHDTEPVSSFPWQKNRWKAMARMTKTETVHD